MQRLEQFGIVSEPPWQGESLNQRLNALQEGSLQVAWIYETPDTTTFRYRVYNMVECLKRRSSNNLSATWFRVAEIPCILPKLKCVDTLVLARVRYNSEVAHLISAARSLGTRVLFDCDDLVFDTSAVHDILDALDQDSSLEEAWNLWFAYIGRLEAVARQCHGGITTNTFLAERLANIVDGPIHVVPNFLNRQQAELSQRLLEIKRAQGFNREKSPSLGYFSGTPTHNHDWAVVAPALESIMLEDPRIKLRIVGFSEFLNSFQKVERSRIEVFPLQDWLSLQILISEVDINLAPLRFSEFANCKSELKYFEAAAVGTYTLATDTFPFRQAIKQCGHALTVRADKWRQSLHQALEFVRSGEPHAASAAEGAANAFKHYGWNVHGDTILSACQLS